MVERALPRLRSAQHDVDVDEAVPVEILGDRRRIQLVGRHDGVVERCSMSLGTHCGEERQEECTPAFEDAAPLGEDVAEHRRISVDDRVAGHEAAQRTIGAIDMREIAVLEREVQMRSPGLGQQ